MENSAFKRGAIAARFWVWLSKNLRAANSACVAWAKRRGLPAFLGRLPIPTAGFAILTIMVVGGLLVGASLLLVVIFSYMISSFTLDKNDSKNDDVSSDNSSPEYRNGRSGYGYYYGSDDSIFTPYKTIDDEDD